MATCTTTYTAAAPRTTAATRAITDQITAMAGPGASHFGAGNPRAAHMRPATSPAAPPGAASSRAAGTRAAGTGATQRRLNHLPAAVDGGKERDDRMGPIIGP